MGKRRMEYFEILENSNDGMKGRKFLYDLNPAFQHSIIPRD
jgi:hypothetical protein